MLTLLLLALLAPTAVAGPATEPSVEASEPSVEASEPPAEPPVAGPAVSERTIVTPLRPPPPPPAVRPLAIPSGQEASAKPGWQDAPPSLHSGALRQYRDQYLALRSFRQLSAQTVSPGLGGYGYGYGGHYGWGMHSSPVTWVRSTDRVGVYQGPFRLNNLDFLSAIGRTDERLQVEHEIRRKRRLARGMYTLMGAGIAASLVGAVGMESAPTVGAYSQWQLVSVGGLATVVGGAIGASFPATRAQALSVDIEAIRALPDVQREISEHNETLRLSLNLSESEAIELER